jgi:hypothetical protein
LRSCQGTPPSPRCKQSSLQAVLPSATSLMAISPAFSGLSQTPPLAYRSKL